MCPSLRKAGTSPPGREKGLPLWAHCRVAGRIQQFAREGSSYPTRSGPAPGRDPRRRRRSTWASGWPPPGRCSLGSPSRSQRRTASGSPADIEVHAGAGDRCPPVAISPRPTSGGPLSPGGIGISAGRQLDVPSPTPGRSTPAADWRPFPRPAVRQAAIDALRSTHDGPQRCSICPLCPPAGGPQRSRPARSASTGPRTHRLRGWHGLHGPFKLCSAPISSPRGAAWRPSRLPCPRPARRQPGQEPIGRPPTAARQPTAGDAACPCASTGGHSPRLSPPVMVGDGRSASGRPQCRARGHWWWRLGCTQDRPGGPRAPPGARWRRSPARQTPPDTAAGLTSARRDPHPAARPPPDPLSNGLDPPHGPLDGCAAAPECPLGGSRAAHQRPIRPRPACIGPVAPFSPTATGTAAPWRALRPARPDRSGTPGTHPRHPRSVPARPLSARTHPADAAPRE